MTSLHQEKTEAALREDLATVFRLIAHFGWDDLIFTHASARLPAAEPAYLVNPYDRMFHEMTADGLVAVGSDGRPLSEPGPVVNPAAFTIHGALHGARHDVACVIHVHTVAGVAVATHEAGLMPLNQSAILLNGQISYHDYEGVAERPDECARIVADLGERAILILRNHGLLVTGSTIPEAFLRLYLLQRACEMQVATLAGGVPLRMPPAPLQTEVQRFTMSPAAVAEMTWPPLKRLLAAKDASFRSGGRVL